MESERLRGTVIWFSSAKGFGFLKREDGGKDVFCHHSQLQMEGYRKLEPEQEVEFEMGSNERGPMAVNVVPL